MVTATRRALKRLRSNIDPEDTMDELAELGEAAVRVLSRELAMQNQNSLFTGRILLALARIADVNERWIDARTLGYIFNETQRFVPQSVVAHDRNGWIVSNLRTLGTQLLRSRYRLDDKEVQETVRAIQRANKGTRHEDTELADVLDGDLDGNPDLKADYVDHIAKFLRKQIAHGEMMMAVTAVRILSCFGEFATAAVPSIIELLELEQTENTGNTDRVFWLLEGLERIGHGATDAVPTVLRLLSFETETLMREDGLMIRIMDTLAGIGSASDDVRRMLAHACNNSAAIIQNRARNTQWKLCIEQST